MNEFIEKLIGRLEELGWVYADYYPDETAIHRQRKKSVAYDDVIEIVNELAEEYKDKPSDEWQIIYGKLCNLEKKYAESDESMGNANFCFTLKQLLRYFKKELCAEEHKDKVMINEQYCWQTCGATEHCKECNRLCNGSIDYYENYDCLLEE